MHSPQPFFGGVFLPGRWGYAGHPYQFLFLLINLVLATCVLQLLMYFVSWVEYAGLTWNLKAISHKSDFSVTRNSNWVTLHIGPKLHLHLRLLFLFRYRFVAIKQVNLLWPERHPKQSLLYIVGFFEVHVDCIFSFVKLLQVRCSHSHVRRLFSRGYKNMNRADVWFLLLASFPTCDSKLKCSALFFCSSKMGWCQIHTGLPWVPSDFMGPYTFDGKVPGRSSPVITMICTSSFHAAHSWKLSQPWNPNLDSLWPCHDPCLRTQETTRSKIDTLCIPGQPHKSWKQQVSLT